MHVRLEEGNEIRAGLADDEVVDVEELDYPTEGRVSIVVGYVCPMVEIDRVGRRPRDNVAVDVFAEQCRLVGAVEGRRRGVRGNCGRPDELDLSAMR